MVTFRCVSCLQVLQATEDQVGKQVQCPNCLKVQTLYAPSIRSPQQEAAQEETERLSPEGPESLAEAVLSELDASAPAAPVRKKGRGFRLGINPRVLYVAAALVLAVGGYVWWRQASTAAQKQEAVVVDAAKSQLADYLETRFGPDFYQVKAVELTASASPLWSLPQSVPFRVQIVRGKDGPVSQLTGAFDQSRKTIVALEGRLSGQDKEPAVAVNFTGDLEQHIEELVQSALAQQADTQLLSDQQALRQRQLEQAFAAVEAFIDKIDVHFTMLRQRTDERFITAGATLADAQQVLSEQWMAVNTQANDLLLTLDRLDLVDDQPIVQEILAAAVQYRQHWLSIHQSGQQIISGAPRGPVSFDPLTKAHQQAAQALERLLAAADELGKQALAAESSGQASARNKQKGKTQQAGSLAAGNAGQQPWAASAGQASAVVSRVESVLSPVYTQAAMYCAALAQKHAMLRQARQQWEQLPKDNSDLDNAPPTYRRQVIADRAAQREELTQLIAQLEQQTRVAEHELALLLIRSQQQVALAQGLGDLPAANVANNASPQASDNAP